MKVRVRYLVEIDIPSGWRLLRAEDSEGFCVLVQGEMLARYGVVAWLSDPAMPYIGKSGGSVYPHDYCDELESAITADRVDEFRIISE